MSELTVTLLRLGYLLLLWVFVLSAIGVLRRDLYGTRILNRRQLRAERRAAGPSSAKPAATGSAVRRANEPTRLVVTEGGLRGTTLPLGASAILIGRAPSCTLVPVSYTHLRAHETRHDLVCRLLLEKKKNKENTKIIDQTNKIKKTQIHKKNNEL